MFTHSCVADQNCVEAINVVDQPPPGDFPETTVLFPCLNEVRTLGDCILVARRVLEENEAGSISKCDTAMGGMGGQDFAWGQVSESFSGTVIQ